VNSRDLAPRTRKSLGRRYATCRAEREV